MQSRSDLTRKSELLAHWSKDLEEMSALHGELEKVQSERDQARAIVEQQKEDLKHAALALQDVKRVSETLADNHRKTIEQKNASIQELRVTLEVQTRELSEARREFERTKLQQMELLEAAKLVNSKEAERRTIGSSRPIESPHVVTKEQQLVLKSGAHAEHEKGEVKEMKPAVKEVVDSNAPSVIENQTDIPRNRAQILEAFPEYIPKANLDPPATFTRNFLSAQLGGSQQPLIVRIAADAQKPVAKELGIRKFLCPNHNKNPWCPQLAGRHGYMFVGLTTERDTFVEPEILNLFMSAPKSHGPLEVTYLGIYEALRVEPLTVAEWQTLTSERRRDYAEIVAGRESQQHKGQSGTTGRRIDTAQCQSRFDSGVYQVPCVQLKCVGFDEALYAALSIALSVRNPGGLSEQRKRASSLEQASPVKRVRA